MTIVEKAAYLKGLAEGLGVDPQSKEGKLWAALNDLLADMAHEIEDLRENDLAQCDALDDLTEELNYLEELCVADDDPMTEPGPACGGCPKPCMPSEPADEDEEEDELEPDYDGVIYDATCPVCGEEISFDEETLEEGSIRCPNCGEILEFDLDGTADEELPEEDGEE